MFQSFTDYKPIIVVSSRNFHADLSCFVFPLSPGRLYIFSDDITIIGDAHVYVCVCVSGGSGQMANRFFSISSCTCRSEDKIKKKKLKTKRLGGTQCSRVAGPRQQHLAILMGAPVQWRQR